MQWYTKETAQRFAQSVVGKLIGQPWMQIQFETGLYGLRLHTYIGEIEELFIAVHEAALLDEHGEVLKRTKVWCDYTGVWRVVGDGYNMYFERPFDEVHDVASFEFGAATVEIK